MHITTGTFATENASKYLQQLCKHFAHKIDVEFAADHGTCNFEFGAAKLTATNDELIVKFELVDKSATESAHMVIEKHLERFAFREGFTRMKWSA